VTYVLGRYTRPRGEGGYREVESGGMATGDQRSPRVIVHVEMVEVALSLNPALAARAATGRSNRGEWRRGDQRSPRVILHVEMV
jgi:hypothetical protein